VWTAPPLTSGFFVLAAFFGATTLLTLIRIFLLAGAALLTASLLTLSRVASRRFLLCTLAALFASTCASATLLHSLVAITIVCHISILPFIDD
jgi:hypothetical protein